MEIFWTPSKRLPAVALTLTPCLQKGSRWDVVFALHVITLSVMKVSFLSLIWVWFFKLFCLNESIFTGNFFLPICQGLNHCSCKHCCCLQMGTAALWSVYNMTLLSAPLFLFYLALCMDRPFGELLFGCETIILKQLARAEWTHKFIFSLSLLVNSIYLPWPLDYWSLQNIFFGLWHCAQCRAEH